MSKQNYQTNDKQEVEYPTLQTYDAIILSYLRENVEKLSFILFPFRVVTSWVTPDPVSVSDPVRRVQVQWLRRAALRVLFTLYLTAI